jgi:hypothetical protein
MMKLLAIVINQKNHQKKEQRKKKAQKNHTQLMNNSVDQINDSLTFFNYIKLLYKKSILHIKFKEFINLF